MSLYPDEKSQPYEDIPGSRDDPPRPSTTRSRIASLFFVSLLLSALVRVSHYCLHASSRTPPRPLTIEGRVKNILSTTPLIGKKSISINPI